VLLQRPHALLAGMPRRLRRPRHDDRAVHRVAFPLSVL